MRSFKEYKERKEAQQYFRQNNDMFLSNDEWITLSIKGLVSAIVLGVAHWFLNSIIPISFSIFYIVVGLMIANVLTSSANRSSHQIGILSAIFTLVSFYVTNVLDFIQFIPMIDALRLGLTTLFSTDIISLLFYILGIVAAYFQGSDNRFM